MSGSAPRPSMPVFISTFGHLLLCAYSSSATASNIPKAADVASAVQKALVDADFKVGVGDDLEPVKSVASVDKFTGNGTAGRRLAESATSGTFRITVVAFAPKLPAISATGPSTEEKPSEIQNAAGW